VEGEGESIKSREIVYGKKLKQVYVNQREESDINKKITDYKAEFPIKRRVRREKKDSWSSPEGSLLWTAAR